MNEKWRQLFTPKHELPPSETTMIEISNLDGVVDETCLKRKTPFRADTPMALIEIICRDRYKDSPRFLEPTIAGSGIDAIYSSEIRIGRFIGNGSSKNLTEAKQIAAYQLLLNIIKNGGHKEFNMVGETKEEALAYVESINPQKKARATQSASIEPSQSSNENWIGQCTTLCDHKDLGVKPKFESEKTGPSHNPEFTITATLPGYPDLKVVTKGSSIKAAKNEAARLFKPLLEALADGPEAEQKRQKRESRKQLDKDIIEANHLEEASQAGETNHLESQVDESKDL